jgi:hypothetical protein
MLSVGGRADTQKAIKGQLSDVDFHAMLYLYGGEVSQARIFFKVSSLSMPLIRFLKRSPCPVH